MQPCLAIPQEDVSRQQVQPHRAYLTETGERACLSGNAPSARFNFGKIGLAVDGVAKAKAQKPRPLDRVVHPDQQYLAAQHLLAVGKQFQPLRARHCGEGGMVIAATHEPLGLGNESLKL